MGKNRKNIIFVLFAYWIAVVLWQTVRPVANRSLVDTLVKTALFAAVCVYAVNHRDIRNTKTLFIWAYFFESTQIITLVADEKMTSSTIITCVFMLAQIVVFLFLLRNQTVDEEDLLWFGKCIITVAVIMGIYNLFENYDRMMQLFSASVGAYGSECSSFLYSNHEFAVYLATAIIFNLWEIFRNKSGNIKKYLVLAFLIFNILTTYSRTAILGCLAAIMVLCFFFSIKRFIGMCAAVGIGGIAVAFNSTLHSFVFDKMLKGSYEETGGVMDQGRSEMYTDAWEYFMDGSFFQKLFGHGYAGNQAGGHDAYLVILNTGGIFMFFFFAAVVIFGLSKSFYCLRHNRAVGALCLATQVFSLMYMIAQTPILFFSTMDAYFITLLTVIIPLYCANNLKKQSLQNLEVESV